MMQRHAFRVIAWLAVGLSVTGLIYGLFGPEQRASAIEGGLSAAGSTAAALTAVWLGRQALRKTEEQIAEVRRATELGRYPLVIPLHQPVSQSGQVGALAQHPPAEERYVFSPADVSAYAFLEESVNRYVVPLENVGEGPALAISGQILCADGRTGELRGVDALGSGRIAVAVCTLERRSGPDAPRKYSGQGGGPSRSEFLLQLHYQDVFGADRNVTAIFESSGRGYWRIVDGHRAEAD